MSKEIDVKGKLVRFDYGMNACVWQNCDGREIFISPDEYRALIKRQNNTN